MSRHGLRAVTVAVGAATILVSGCRLSINSTITTAECAASGRLDNPTLILMAQAVPTAPLIPCILSTPAGWSKGPLNVRSGRARFVLASDRDGPRAVTVQLTKTCDIRGATNVPSEQPAARRYERPQRISHGYAGDRYYVYRGACTTYRFNFTGATRAQPLADLTTALGFVSRQAVRDLARRQNGGHLELDPRPTRASHG